MRQALRSLICLILVSIFHLPSLAATFNVDSFNDQTDANIGNNTCATSNNRCTLRAAIQEANNNPSGDTIILQAGTYALSLTGNDDISASGDLDITTDLDIQGQGADKTLIQVDNNRSFRVFHISPGNQTITVNLSKLSINNGRAEKGAGIYLNSGKLIITDSAIENNKADQINQGLGGGIYNFAGILIINRSLIANNTAGADGQGFGGGIYTESPSGTYINNSTIAQNSALSGRGGGLYNHSNIMHIASSTIAQNQVSNSNASGAGLYNNVHDQGSILIKNTIIADNGIINSPSTTVSDCDGHLTSEGFNLIGIAINECAELSQNNDQIGTPSATLDAKLGNLSDNGGDIQSLPISADSIAVDTGSTNNCTGYSDTSKTISLSFDQRGSDFPRAVIGKSDTSQTRCDIGSFEFSSTPGPTPDTQNPIAYDFSFTTWPGVTIRGSLPVTGTNIQTNQQQPFQFTTVTSSQKGGLGLNSNTGFFTYDTNPNASGNDSFQFRVTDSNNLTSNDATVSINIQNGSPPQPPPLEILNIDFILKSNDIMTGNFGIIDAFGDGSRPNWNIANTDISGPANGQLNLFKNSNDAQPFLPMFTYTPIQGNLSNEQFTVTLRDNSTGSERSDTATINLVVNDTGNDTQVTLENITFNASKTSRFNDSLSSSITNPNNLNLIYNPTEQPIYGNVTIDTNGNFTYQPPSNIPNNVNSVSFRFNVTYIDSETQRNVTTSSATITLSFTDGGGTNPVNVSTSKLDFNNISKQNASDLSLTTGVNVTGNPTLTFERGPTRDNDLQFGNININNNGTFTYTPNNNIPNNATKDEFTYQVRYQDDNQNNQTTNFALVTLNFNSVDTSVIVPDFTFVNISKTNNSTKSLTDRITNPNNLNLTYQINKQSTQGTTSINNAGRVTYNPNSNLANNISQDTFTYSVQYTENGTEFNQSATITLEFSTTSPNTVSASNFTISNVPRTEATNDTLSTNITKPSNITVTYVKNSDPSPSRGTLTQFNADTGNFTYTPNSNLADNITQDTFTYSVRYAENGDTKTSNVATVTVQFVSSGTTPTNQAIANPGKLETVESTQVTGQLTGQITGVSPIKFVIRIPPTKGQIQPAPDKPGLYNYIPNAGFTGSDSFQFRVEDPSDASVVSANATITITVKKLPSGGEKDEGGGSGGLGSHHPWWLIIFVPYYLLLIRRLCARRCNGSDKQPSYVN